jgi:hypothetical protein
MKNKILTQNQVGSVAKKDLFGSFLKKETTKKNSQEMTDVRAGEIALDFVLEQVRRGLWANPPVEAKLYLCGESGQVIATNDEIEAFITKISKSG